MFKWWRTRHAQPEAVRPGRFDDLVTPWTYESLATENITLNAGERSDYAYKVADNDGAPIDLRKAHIDLEVWDVDDIDATVPFTSIQTGSGFVLSFHPEDLMEQTLYRYRCDLTSAEGRTVYMTSGRIEIRPRVDAG